MKKNLFTGALALTISASFLAGCGYSGSSASTTAAATQTATTAAAADTTAAAAEASGDTTAAAGDTAGSTSDYDFTKDPIDLKLGVTGSIYEEMWQPAVDLLKDEGINLEIVQFSDYVTPNNALNSGEIDLNGFQHRIYLQSEIDQYGYKIQNIGNTFITPLNIYSKKLGSFDELKDGDTVAVPNDPTNEGRALKVLASSGVIKLKDDANFNPTLDDIESYTKQIKIEELSANTIPSTLEDVTAGVINGNFALDFGLSADDIVFKDDVLSDQQYWNLIAARTEDLSDPKLVAAYDKVVEAYQSQGTQDVYDTTFKGFYIAEGWDEDLLADYKK